jgi:hypothetical protein
VDLDYDQDDIERTQMIAYANDSATVTGGSHAEYMYRENVEITKVKN